MDSMITFLSPTKGRRPRSFGSDQNSETALASPEIHRWAFLLFFKLLAPSSFTFLANETPLTTILGIWYPIILSFYMLQRHQSQRISIQARANERRLWLHYWSMMATWQFLRRSMIDSSLQSTFGIFFLVPWTMKQTILSSLAQLELCAAVLLVYPIVYSKSWNGTIRLTTKSWNQSSFVYRIWERHLLSKIVTRETTLSLLSEALVCSSSSFAQDFTDGDDAQASSADQEPKSELADDKTNSFLTYVNKILEKTYQLATQLIAVAQWFGLLSDSTVTSAKSLWSKVARVPAGLVLPPLFLAVMPSNFCVKLGLQYLQWIYTASMSLKAASQDHSSKDTIIRNGNHGDANNVSTFLSQSKRDCTEEIYWLQYWIIHATFVFGGLDYVSSQLPFWFKGLVLWNFWLTATWIWLLHDSKIVPCIFDVLTSELVGLGLVPYSVLASNTTSRHSHRGRESRPRANISETNTAKFAQYVLEQLPRASSSEDTAERETRKAHDGQDIISSVQWYPPDLVAASSSLSTESSGSISPSSSPVASKKKLGAREGSAWTYSPSSTSNGCIGSNQPVARAKERRKRYLLRYRQHLRSQQSSPTSSLSRS